jgi:hypothetical protein
MVRCHPLRMRDPRGELGPKSKELLTTLGCILAQTTRGAKRFPSRDPDSARFAAPWDNEKAQRRLCPLKGRALNTFGAFYTIRVQESMIF